MGDTVVTKEGLLKPQHFTQNALVQSGTNIPEGSQEFLAAIPKDAKWQIRDWDTAQDSDDVPDMYMGIDTALPDNLMPATNPKPDDFRRIIQKNGLKYLAGHNETGNPIYRTFHFCQAPAGSNGNGETDKFFYDPFAEGIQQYLVHEGSNGFFFSINGIDLTDAEIFLIVSECDINPGDYKSLPSVDGTRTQFSLIRNVDTVKAILGKIEKISDKISDKKISPERKQAIVDAIEKSQRTDAEQAKKSPTELTDRATIANILAMLAITGLGLVGQKWLMAYYNKPKLPADPLAAYTEDLTARAERGEFPPLVGREAEVLQTMARLTDPKQPNAGITAKDVPGKKGAGTGKTALLYEIARRIAQNHSSVPPALRGQRLLQVSDTRLRGGNAAEGEGDARYAGMYEGRAISVMDAARWSKTPIILVWEEAASLFETHGASDDPDEPREPLIKKMLMDLDGRPQVVPGDLEARIVPSTPGSSTTRIEIISGIPVGKKQGLTFPDNALMTVFDASGNEVSSLRVNKKTPKVIEGESTFIEIEPLPPSAGNYYRIEIASTGLKGRVLTRQRTLLNRPNNFKGNVFITTPYDYKKTFGATKWQDVNRRVDWVRLPEMTDDQTRDALKKREQRGYYQKMYGDITITDEAIDAAVKLGGELDPQGSNPGRVIKILKTAAASLQGDGSRGQLTRERVMESAAIANGTNLEGLERRRLEIARREVRREKMNQASELASVQGFFGECERAGVFIPGGKETHIQGIILAWNNLRAIGEQGFWIPQSTGESPSCVPVDFIFDYLETKGSVDISSIIHAATQALIPGHIQSHGAIGSFVHMDTDLRGRVLEGWSPGDTPLKAAVTEVALEEAPPLSPVNPENRWISRLDRGFLTEEVSTAEFRAALVGMCDGNERHPMVTSFDDLRVGGRGSFTWSDLKTAVEYGHGSVFDQVVTQLAGERTEDLSSRLRRALFTTLDRVAESKRGRHTLVTQDGAERAARFETALRSAREGKAERAEASERGRRVERDAERGRRAEGRGRGQTPVPRGR